MSDTLIREMAPGDLAYIMATGLRTWRSLDKSFLPDTEWFAVYRNIMERLLASPLTNVKILCSADMPDEILGYIIGSETALWQIYVRKSLRRMGLAKQLMSAAGVTPTTPSAWAVPELRRYSRSLNLRSHAALSTARK